MNQKVNTSAEIELPHTSLPWIAESESIMFDTGVEPHPTSNQTRYIHIAELSNTPNWLANRGFIIRAVNCHYELLEACQAFVKRSEAVYAPGTKEPDYVKIARAAIARAKGEA